MTQNKFVANQPQLVKTNHEDEPEPSTESAALERLAELLENEIILLGKAGTIEQVTGDEAEAANSMRAAQGRRG